MLSQNTTTPSSTNDCGIFAIDSTRFTLIALGTLIFAIDNLGIFAKDNFGIFAIDSNRFTSIAGSPNCVGHFYICNR